MTQVNLLTTIPTVNQVSDPPNSTQSEDEFNANADALLGNLPDLVDDLNAFALGANALGSYVAGAASVAAQSANAVKWISGTNYAQFAPVFSPLNSQSYRSKVALNPSTVDPSLDPTNWDKISGTTDADTVDGFHASQTPVAGQIAATKGDGTTAFPGGISVGNANANGGSILLSWIEKATFTLTGTGFSSSPTGVASFVRIGDMATVSFPIVTGTSNTSGFTLTGMPTSVRPSTTRKCFARITDSATGATVQQGMVSIGSDGVITVYRNADGGVWTNTGTKSIQVCSITFDI